MIQNFIKFSYKFPTVKNLKIECKKMHLFNDCETDKI